MFWACVIRQGRLHPCRRACSAALRVRGWLGGGGTLGVTVTVDFATAVVHSANLPLLLFNSLILSYISGARGQEILHFINRAHFAKGLLYGIHADLFVCLSLWIDSSPVHWSSTELSFMFVAFSRSTHPQCVCVPMDKGTHQLEFLPLMTGSLCLDSEKGLTALKCLCLLKALQQNCVIVHSFKSISIYKWRYMQTFLTPAVFWFLSGNISTHTN